MNIMIVKCASQHGILSMQKMNRIGFAIMGGFLGIAMVISAIAILLCALIFAAGLFLMFAAWPWQMSIITFIFVLGAGIAYYNYERLVG